MNPRHFDTISQLFASRRTRRQAIAGTAGLAALAAMPTLGQESTPAPEFDISDPHPGADDATADPEFLFVQPFNSGTWAPKEGVEGTYTLTLTGMSANTVYFSDRPDRIFGLTPTGPFLETLGFTPANPPNAALVAQRPDGGDQEVLVVELTNPVYDEEATTLTYDVVVLADYDDVGLAHAAQKQQDYLLPETFAEGSLFIDDCGETEYNCYGVDSGTLYGWVNVGYCADSKDPTNLFCAPCHSPDDYCMDGLPEYCRQEVHSEGGTFYVSLCTASERYDVG